MAAPESVIENFCTNIYNPIVPASAVTVQDSAKVIKNSSILNVTLYPNPTNDYLYIKPSIINDLVIGNLSIKVFDLTGRLVSNPILLTELPLTEKNTFQYNVSQLSFGIYYFLIVDKESGTKFGNKIMINR